MHRAEGRADLITMINMYAVSVMYFAGMMLVLVLEMRAAWCAWNSISWQLSARTPWYADLVWYSGYDAACMHSRTYSMMWGACAAVGTRC